MIGVLGVNHQTADIRVRELFSFTEETNIQLLKALKNESGHFQEAFILSTCNRTEIYFRFQDICMSGSKSVLFRKIEEVLKVNIDLYRECFYFKYEDDVYDHLFRVASGLDSIAIGEYQIVNQIKDSFQIAKKTGTTGKYLTRLFNKALEISKIVRNKTGISQGATSISFLAVDRCIKVSGCLENKKILLLGLGQTGELVLKKFIKKDARHITISNRTIERAQKKADFYNGSYLPFEEAINSIADFDIIVTSTSAGKIILSEMHVKNALQTRPQNDPVIFIDLSVPRNIDEKVACFQNAVLLNIDDLEAELSENMQERENMTDIANEYIKQGLDEFVQWLSMQNISPLANNIKKRLHNIHAEELQGFIKNRTEEEKAIMETYGKHIAEKYSRIFIKNLVDLTDNGRQTDFIKIANKIFE